MPGSERNPQELDINNIVDRAANAVAADPYAQLILNFLFPSPRTASATMQEHARQNFIEGKRQFEQLSRGALAREVKPSGPPPLQAPTAEMIGSTGSVHAHLPLSGGKRKDNKHTTIAESASQTKKPNRRAAGGRKSSAT
jgi:hypothetical protein